MTSTSYHLKFSSTIFEQLKEHSDSIDLSEYRNELSKWLFDIEKVDLIIEEYKKLLQNVDFNELDRGLFEKWVIDNIYFIGSKCFNHDSLFTQLTRFQKNKKFQQYFTHFVENITPEYASRDNSIKKIKNIVVLFSGNCGGGHKAPAMALANYLKSKQHNIKIIDFDAVDDMYSPKVDGITRSQVYSEIIQKQGNKEKANKIQQIIFNKQLPEKRRYLTDIKKLISEFKTDHIFSVAHHKPQLSYLSFQLGVPMTYVHTDYNFNYLLKPLALAQAQMKTPLITFTALNCESVFFDTIFDAEEQTIDLDSLRSIQRQIVRLDFPVRDSFRSVTAQELSEIRSQLKIPNGAIVCKIAMGQNGIAKEIESILTKLIREEKELNQPLYVFVVCGSNKSLQKELTSKIGDLLKDVQLIQVHILGFLEEQDMAQVDRASDIWITKPGGSTSAELIQTQKQMLYVPNKEHPWELANAAYLEKLQLAEKLSDDTSIISQIHARLKVHKTLNSRFLPQSDWKNQLDSILNHSDAEKLGAIAKETLQTKLSAKQLTDIVRCITTILPRYLQLGYVNLDEATTALPCLIQYDPETKLVYVHPKDSYEERLGNGCWKIVTRSIAFDPKQLDRPTAVACLRMREFQNDELRKKYSKEFDAEIALFNKFANAKYLTSALAVTKEVTENDEIRFRVIQKIYSLESLGRLVHKKELDFDRKAAIGTMMLQSLAELHAQGYVHHDIHLGNFLVDESFNIALTDFGYTNSKNECRGQKAQHMREYTAPEALSFEKLCGDDYEKVDLFALGCCLFRLHAGHRPRWIEDSKIKSLYGKHSDFIKMDDTEKACAIQYFKQTIEQEIGGIRKNLVQKLKQKALTQDEVISYVIAHLLHIDPKERQNAQYWLDFICSQAPVKPEKPMESLINCMQNLHVSRQPVTNGNTKRVLPMRHTTAQADPVRSSSSSTVTGNKGCAEWRIDILS